MCRFQLMSRQGVKLAHVQSKFNVTGAGHRATLNALPPAADAAPAAAQVVRAPTGPLVTLSSHPEFVTAGDFGIAQHAHPQLIHWPMAA